MCHSISEVSRQEAHNGHLCVLTNSKCLFKWLIYRMWILVYEAMQIVLFFIVGGFEIMAAETLLSPQYNWKKWHFIHGAQRIKKIKLKKPTVPLCRSSKIHRPHCEYFTLFLTFTAIKTDINKGNGAILATNPHWKLVNELKLMPQCLSGKMK